MYLHRLHAKSVTTKTLVVYPRIVLALLLVTIVGTLWLLTCLLVFLPFEKLTGRRIFSWDPHEIEEDAYLPLVDNEEDMYF